MTTSRRDPLFRLACLFVFTPAVLAFVLAPLQTSAEPFANPYQKWRNGPPKDKSFFPIAVWCQGPHNAARYREIGINVYLALWNGPTSEQLAALKTAGMRTICAQNQVGLTDKNNDVIIGWMHGDEPDNSQALPDGKGWGSPVDPKVIQTHYQKIVDTDPTRPVLLNLGWGVGWDGWYGRGPRTGHPEDYAEYVKGCDIASFDIYPLSHEKPKDAIYGKAEVVAFGVDRLRKWAGPERPVWNCIECTRIGNPDYMPKPHMVRNQVWMSLVHGSQGLVYFVHQFKPTPVEAGIFLDKEMTSAVGEINYQIQSLASMLNSPTLNDLAEVKSSEADASIDTMVKREGKTLYVFAVSMRNKASKATVTLKQGKFAGAEVLGESRTIRISGNTFSDNFTPYAVHLYKIPAAQ